MTKLLSTRSTVFAATTLALGYLACSPADGVPGGDGDGTASGGATVGSGAAPSSGGMMGNGASSSGGGGATGSGGDGWSLSSGGESSSGGAQASGGAVGDDLGPIMRSDTSYVLEFSGYFFEVDPTQGSIIKTFSLEGDNILIPVEFKNDFTNGGSQIWVAPQDATWGWPPPPSMDSEAHPVTVDGMTFSTMSAAIDLTTSSNTITIGKSFSPNLTDGSIDMSIEVMNIGTTTATLSPWQITRVNRGGITFWPKGDDACGGTDPVPTIPETDGVYFWDDATLGAALTNNKFSCDGSQGWIAHVSGSLLMVKTWADVPSTNQHDVDKEIQLYFGDGYEEFEMRGAYEDIAMGASTTWDVRWYLRDAPTDLSEASLVAAVQAIID